MDDLSGALMTLMNRGFVKPVKWPVLSMLSWPRFTVLILTIQHSVMWMWLPVEDQLQITPVKLAYADR